MRETKALEVGGHGDARTGKRDLKGMCIIENRAKVGPCSGAPFMDCISGVLIPEDSDPENPKTWLQPGEKMTVPLEIAFHVAGDVWDDKLPDRMDIIRRYGGFEYEQSDRTAVGRAVPLKEVGPPPLPDLVLQKTDARGRPLGKPIAMYERYLKGLAPPRTDKTAAA